MAYTRTAVGIGMILMATTVMAPAATLRVDDATAQAGGTAQVAVSLDNPEDDVRALQFSLGPLPAGVEFGDVAAAGRAVALTADAEAQPDGTVKVVLISLGRETVEAGSGPVLDLYFAADEPGRFELAPTEVHVAGTGGALDVTGEGGQLNVEAGSPARASGGGCAVGPVRSAGSAWFMIVLGAACLVVRSISRPPLQVPKGRPSYPLAMVVLSMTCLASSAAALEFSLLRQEGFEDADTEFSITATGTTFTLPASDAVHSGSGSLRVNPSGCGASCFDAHRVDLVLNFAAPTAVGTVQLWVREGSTTGSAWGAKMHVGHDDVWDLYWSEIIDNGAPVTDQWQFVSVPIDQVVNAVKIRIWDITSVSTVWLDDIRITAPSGSEGSMRGTWNQIVTSGGPPRDRGWQSAIYDPVLHRMIIFGGWSGSLYNSLNDTWALDLATRTWTQLATTGGPPPNRASHVAVYDSSRRRMVVSGGSNWWQTWRNDTWALDLNTNAWTQLTTTGGPPSPRLGAGGFYDSKRDRLVIFGGANFGGPQLNDTWALSLSTLTWTQVSTTGGPPSPREEFASAYDPASDRFIVAGGWGGGADAWALDMTSNTWARIENPPYHFVKTGTAFDPVTGNMIMVGGEFGIPPEDMALVFNVQAHAWRDVDVIGATPQPRGMEVPSAIFDPVNNRTIMFGGGTSLSTTFNDTWELSLEPREPVLIDDFNDNVINPSLWRAARTGTGVTVAETGQRLEIALDHAATPEPGGWIYGGYSTRERMWLRGDFDVQVDYALLNWPSANGVRVSLEMLSAASGTVAVERVSFGSNDFPDWPREVYLTHFGSKIVYVRTDDQSGGLRLVRSGNRVTGYYRHEGGWVAIDSASAATEDLPFSINAATEDRYFGRKDVRIAFDNFTVNSGQVIFASPNATLEVGNTTTAPGQQRVAIPILLTNDVAVRAVQFTLTDTPDQVTLSAAPTCATTARSSGLSCDCNQSGGVIRCVLLSTGTATIAAGSGQVATVFVDDTAPSCTAGQTIQLNLSETAVADVNNSPVSHTTVNGSLRCGCPEDLNCDSQVNIFDALICVDLILGRNPPRCADADLDGNGRTDIFDCLRIVDTIIGRRPGCGA